MKNNRFFMLVKASAKAHKLVIILFCLFVVISTVLIFMAVSIIFPLYNNIENNINNHIYNREMIISFSKNVPNNEINEKIENINKIEHIDSVYMMPETQMGTDLTKNIPSSVDMVFVHNTAPIHIMSGRAFKETEQNVAVIPKTIKAYDDNKRQFITINGDSIIGKKLKLNYYEKLNYCPTVVGTYDNSDPMFSQLQVLIPQKDLLKCDNLVINQEKKYNIKVNEDKNYLVVVDNYKNFDKALKQVSTYCIADKYNNLSIDQNAFNMAMLILFIVLGIFIIVVFAGLYLFLSSDIKGRTSEMALYRSLGYKSKDIFSILFYQHLLFEMSSFIVGVIFAVAINKLFVDNVLKSVVGDGFMKMTTEINAIEILAVIIVFVLILFIICKKIVKRTEKIDLTILLREN